MSDQAPYEPSTSANQAGARALDQLLEEAITRNHRRRRSLLAFVMLVVVVPAFAAGILLFLSGASKQEDMRAAISAANVASAASVSDVNRQLGDASTLLTELRDASEDTSQRMRRLDSTTNMALASAERVRESVEDTRNRLESVSNQVAASGQQLAELRSSLAVRERELAEVRARVQEALEARNTFASDAALSELSARVRALESRAAPAREFRFVSYVVRENAETTLRDVNLRLNLGPVRDKSVAVSVFGTNSITLVSARELSLVDGEIEPIVFADSRFEYQLLLAYFEKKWLRKDVLGVAVGRRER